jgi:hypothetical protein
MVRQGVSSGEIDPPRRPPGAAEYQVRTEAIADLIRKDILADRSVVDTSECMTCGRSVDREKAAKLGGRRRFCSDRCMAYFDGGWEPRRGPKFLLPGSDAKSAACVPKSASGRSRSEAAKHRAKVQRKAAFAESWKKYQAKQKAAALSSAA